MDDKYYTRSNGEKIKLAEMNTKHISNAMAKKMEDLFTSSSKDEFSSKLKEVDNLKEEYHKRLNEFYDKLGE